MVNESTVKESIQAKHVGGRGCDYKSLIKAGEISSLSVFSSVFSVFFCPFNGLLQIAGSPPNVQKHVQGKLAAVKHLLCAFQHCSVEAQAHLTISNMYCGARATSDGIVTGPKTYEGSSFYIHTA